MMDATAVLSALLGGCLIGLSVTMMLLFNGRVVGVSGIVASSLTKSISVGLWRWLFLLGMILGGWFMHMARPELFVNLSGRSAITTAIAGLLVGYGTTMGNGCTSGHGVCGISRLSIRSIIATLTFMLFGLITVLLFNSLGGAQ